MDRPDAYTLARELKTLLQDLGQYLGFQKDLGVSHIPVSTETRQIVDAWGTRAWHQHRFICMGPDNARIMLVDGKGSFFQDKAGRLLVRILSAMHLTPEQVMICNAADFGQIRSRAERSRPAAVIALGQAAVSLLLGQTVSLDQVQGQFHDFAGTRLMPTRHPDELVLDPGLKRSVWENMQQVMALAGL